LMFSLDCAEVCLDIIKQSVSAKRIFFIINFIVLFLLK
jgi:hypothetical protein